MEIGIDIEEVGRFRKLPYKSNQSFYKKIFTFAEINYCLSKVDPYPHFAVRFAVKEAIIKAVGLRLKDLIDIGITSSQDGVPSAKVKGQKGKFLISLSHTKKHAIAMALWLN
ncbi:MAG: 4'-phosphopantetheinyl transferase superfamily protein [bacterium]|nr:4'-phosphopantetheinyl transferase superfamily protein [bacterium]